MTTKPTIEPTQLESKIKSSLDASVISLDQDTQQALAAMREISLKKQQHRTWFNFNAWRPASAFALSALLAILFVYQPNSLDDALQRVASQQNISHEQPEHLTMLELITNTEDLETATDPDFYVWIDEVLATEGMKNAV
jgi:hypothetical protein